MPVLLFTKLGVKKAVNISNDVMEAKETGANYFNVKDKNKATRKQAKAEKRAAKHASREEASVVTAMMLV